MAADVDERHYDGEPPAEYVRRLAEAKARAIAIRNPGRAVLAADTTVVVGGVLLGKPSDDAEAARMLRLLAGRAHAVLTAVALATGGPDLIDARVAITEVTMTPLTDAQIAWYVASGEHRDKAGAYAIQGLASRFVTRIDGSYTNVVGLPVQVVCDLCTAAGMLLS